MAMSRQLVPDPPIIVTVRRAAAAGLIVVLPDGSEGLIRERELGWDAAARRGWTERYKHGDLVQVVALGKGRDRRPEMSTRLAQSSSWFDIERRYPIGSLVTGVVTGIMPYGVFVELDAGIIGLLHSSRFPPWMQRPPGDLFWPGDLIKVIIHAVDVEHQRIALSMAELSDRRWRNTTSVERQGTSPPAEQAQIQLIRSQQGGQVEIRLAQAMRDGRQVLQVSVEDDGPGIHRRLWERVFEMDYTTRPEAPDWAFTYHAI